MAKALVNSLAAEWDPSKYTDQYRENLMRIVKGKIEGAELELEADEDAARGEVVDLMERLRRSLAQTGGTRKGAGAASPHAHARKRRKRLPPGSGRGTLPDSRPGRIADCKLQIADSLTNWLR